MKNVTVCTVRSTYLSFSVAVGIKTFGLILNLLCVQFFAWTKKSAFEHRSSSSQRMQQKNVDQKRREENRGRIWKIRNSSCGEIDEIRLTLHTYEATARRMLSEHIDWEQRGETSLA